MGTDGNFYGTTFYGGAYDAGTVFRMTPTGKLTTLLSFDGGLGGANPNGLVQGIDGDFYATTRAGGEYTCELGVTCGTFFKITTAGKFTSLFSFSISFPDSTLVLGTDGNFYGVAYYGTGAVFEITPTGGFTILAAPGGYMYGGLIQATDENFYAPTAAGGLNARGSIVELPFGSTGVWNVIYSFCSLQNCSDGASPNNPLIQATDGNIYGATVDGGQYSYGTIFRLSVGLEPFVQAQPVFGKVGAKLIILGNNLTGATGVSFNGTAAAYNVVSATEITTTVPSGATTGPIQVTAPGPGTLSSLPFWITPQLKSFTPTKGPVGTQVQITGVSLTQTTGVSFDGVSATEFTVNSDTEVTATVPSGATSGTITITTLGGAATSTKSFRVTE